MITFARFTAKVTLAGLLSAGVLALAAPGSALAAPAGAEGPDHCTFKHGVTTCEHTKTTTQTHTSQPDPETGCTTTMITFTTIVAYTAHRGTCNSGGRTVQGPPGYGLGGTAFSVDCPTA